MALIYNASFNNQTRILSLLDKAGNVISSCEVPSKNTELTLTATADNSSVKLIKNGTLYNTYEVDTGSGWSSYTFGTVIPLNAGERCKWRCSEHPINQSSDNYVQFVMTGTIEASGNCNSMLSRGFKDRTSIYGYANAFCKLFKECTALTKAPQLPATTLASGCYHSMFDRCTALTKAPDLPATTLPDNCYYGMFNRCAALTQAPSLPATTLSIYCYSWMFNGCSSLAEVRIAATTTADYAIYNWLSDVSATGDFYCDPNATIFPSGAAGIPANWSRWVYGAEDTGNTATMYHNGSTETVRVGTSDYGACYSAQGWAGFKLLSEMHKAGYTLQEPVPTTVYNNGEQTSVDKIDANGLDGFSEDMYLVDGVFQTLDDIHVYGYTLQEPVPTMMCNNGGYMEVGKIEAGGADGFSEDMYLLNDMFMDLEHMHSWGYTLGAQTPITMYDENGDPVSAYSCDANVDDGFTETMYDVCDGFGYQDIETQNANGYTLNP